jgi:hypothetical protein
MQAEQIIQYLLIGNLNSGKVIYEMSNTTDPKTIFDINQIFNTYFRQKQHRIENTRIESYYLTITIERNIMISKTSDSFPFEQNFELFKKIKEGVPELSKISLNWNLYIHKKKLNKKITYIIHEYFKSLNNNQLIMNTISFKKNNSKINRKFTNNYYNEEEMNMRFKNNLINNSKSFDADKNSLNQLIEDKPINNFDKNEIPNKNKTKKISINIIDDNNEQDKTNISKSLIQSSLLIKNGINIRNSLNSLQTSQISKGLLRDLQNLIWNISCCKKVIMVFLVLIIIAQIIAIPLIINYSYSY